MTVAELIAELQKLDPNLPVWHSDSKKGRVKTYSVYLDEDESVALLCDWK